MPGERDSAALVVGQEGDLVQVEHRGERLSIPMKGFPPDFKLQKGNRVILVDEPSGTVARPLVRVILTAIAPEAIAKGEPVEVEGRQLEIQQATIFEERRGAAQARRGDQYVAWVLVEDAGRDRSDQVVALRRTR